MALTVEQIAERVGYIGASDAAAVCGLSRWKTPIQIWAEKTGAVEPEDISDKLHIQVGNELEDLVCKLWTKRTGKKLHRVNETLTHPKYPFIRCNIDRRVVGENTIFEAKTASAWKAQEWSGEEIPSEYIIQALHSLAVTGADKCEIAVLIGGNVDFVYKTIHRDPAAMAEIIRKEVDFWTRFVEPKIMPTVVTKHDADILFKLFPNGDETEVITLTDEANKLAESIQALQQDQKLLEDTIDKEKNVLRAMLGDKAVGLTNRYKITWKGQVTERLDTAKLKIEKPQIYSEFLKPTSSRVLRITEIKDQKK